jgi:hypothetical protein
MGIFVRTKFSSPSEFKCNSNTSIFSPIRCELRKLCKFYNMYPKMVGEPTIYNNFHNVLHIYGSVL